MINNSQTNTGIVSKKFDEGEETAPFTISFGDKVLVAEYCEHFERTNRMHFANQMTGFWDSLDKVAKFKRNPWNWDHSQHFDSQIGSSDKRKKNLRQTQEILPNSLMERKESRNERISFGRATKLFILTPKYENHSPNDEYGTLYI